MEITAGVGYVVTAGFESSLCRFRCRLGENGAGQNGGVGLIPLIGVIGKAITLAG